MLYGIHAQQCHCSKEGKEKRSRTIKARTSEIHIGIIYLFLYSFFKKMLIYCSIDHSFVLRLWKVLCAYISLVACGSWPSTLDILFLFYFLSNHNTHKDIIKTICSPSLITHKFAKKTNSNFYSFVL